MKKILLLLLLFTIGGYSQSGFRLNDKRDFNAYLIVDPNASFKENGLNIGAGIEYMEYVYVGASITTFPALKDGYTEFIGSFGLPFTSGYFGNVKYYVGLRGGVINRARTYPTGGFEGGINVRVFENVSIGLKTTYIYRSDFTFYDYPNEFRASGFVVIIFKLN